MTLAGLLEPEAEWRDWSPAEKARLRWRLETDLHPESPRPNMLPPDGDWLIWLVMAGRGWGKTRTGAETFAQWIEDAGPGFDWAVAAPTFRDVRETCFEGSVGLLKALTPERVANYNRSTLEITCVNGSKVHGISADEPDRFHGKNLAGAWCDEVALWRYDAAWYEGLTPALRIGARPRVIVTTTPRPTRLMLDLTGRDDGTVVITRGSTFENERGLSEIALAELRRRYEGTRLGAQELHGELLTAIEGALWRGEDITYGEAPDDLARVVISVDPAVTFNEDSDETGIIVAATEHAERGTFPRVFVLEDDTLSPQEAGDARGVMRHVASIWHALDLDAKTDRVVIEKNNGGEYLPGMLRMVDSSIPTTVIDGRDSKDERAANAAMLYEQRQVIHVERFEKLEDQMTRWTPAEKKYSPDRLDALVYAVKELRPDAWRKPRTLAFRGAA